MVYERRGKDFESILNCKYGSCNFTSFVRFIVPQDYEHRYLAFIKYKKDNRLSEETSLLVDELIDSYYEKEERVGKWWKEVDQEIVFRGYCYPCENSISKHEVAL